MRHQEDPHQEVSYLSYLDANNLYGWAKSQPLPYGFFEWITDEEEMKALIQNVATISAHSREGFAFEVDLWYGDELHDLHSDFPLAPERYAVRTDDLSPYCKGLLDDVMGRKSLGTCEKLIPNLNDKTKYVLHYSNLQLYLQLGLKVKKVQRVLKFKQSACLKIKHTST